MNRSRAPNVFTIPVHRAFADVLAAGLVREHGGKPLGLARGMVLLPNNRAVTALRDAFIRLAGGAVLLPRLVALGDDDLDAAAGAALDPLDSDPLPPVIDPVARQLLLAELVRRELPDRAASLGEALRLADSLAHMLDALTFEELGFADLLGLADESATLAEHWREALHIFTRIAVLWPAELAARGLTDRAVARGMMLERTALRWQRDGLPRPWVVAAGISTSAPAVARLLRTVAFAEGGCVIFPHLDTVMPDDHWQGLGCDPRDHVCGDSDDPPLESHAQFHLKLLLDRMGVARGEVAEWPDISPADGPDDRIAVLRHMLAPAQLTRNWPSLRGELAPLAGVSVVECATPAEEALSIAIALRETLETPGKTAALVTPDRNIAAMVAGHLVRWGIRVDDSAGQPLSHMPAGALLLALADAAAAHFSPVALLALLGHPLVQADEERGKWLEAVRELDLLLRGPAPPSGLRGITAVSAGKPEIEPWWTRVASWLAPLDDDAPRSLADWLDRALAVLDALAGDAVWAKADGRALADLVERLHDHAVQWTEPVDAADLAALLRATTMCVAVRPQLGGHPRLFVWGLIEARLQRADRMILAGLNEGQWPQPPSPDPWLSAGIRRRLGLPGLDRQIGLASHDFASALGAREVILTRATRSGGAPTIASRLKLRIDALLGENRPGKGPVDYCALARSLDEPDEPLKPQRPAPNPPVALRPRRLSASSVDGLLADPFSWYARTILGLEPLDRLESPPDAAWRGTEVHLLLEHWLREDGHDVEALVAATRARLARSDVNPLLRTLWESRLCAALRWAGSTIVAHRAEGRVPILTAVERRATIEIAGITLSGKADRIDRLADGSLAIVDYKTGSSPTMAAVDAGFALQLGLLGAMAEDGAFEGADGTATCFEYWRLKRKGDQFGFAEIPFYKTNARVDAGNFVARARERLAEAALWLTEQRPFVAQLHPEFAPYGDYHQLMRLDEWYGALTGSAEA